MKRITLMSLFCWLMTLPLHAHATGPTQKHSTKTKPAVALQRNAAGHVMNLRDVLIQAQANDPIYRQAKANYEAAREALPQSIAKYLPHAQIVGSITQSRDNTTSTPTFSEESLGIVKYPTENYSLNMIQPIFNYKDIVLIKEAKASVKQAYYRYLTAYQELVIRNAHAYFALLQTQNDLESAKKKRDSSLAIFNQAKERLRVGMIAKTIFNDAEAVYDRDVALVLSKENDVADKKEDLRRIIGFPVEKIAHLKANIPLVSANPKNIAYWESFTIRNNKGLKAAHYGTEAAKQALESEQAQHLPVVNGIATLTKYRQGSQGFGPTAYTHRSAGVEFTFPLFEGGNVLSLSRQAQHEYESAAAKEEEIRRMSISSIRKAFLGIESGIAQVKAGVQALRSGESALASNKEAFRVGMRNITEVIDAERNLYATRVVYSQDQIDYIMNHLLLRQAAGTLSAQDIEMINAWLV